MFTESLIDSSPRTRKGKRWPMAAAFTLEATAAGLAVLLPLLSTGVIPVHARDVITTPVRSVRIAEQGSRSRSRSAPSPTGTVIVQLMQRPDALYIGHSVNTSPEPPSLAPGPIGQPNGIPSDFMEGNFAPPKPPAPERPRRISVLSEAQLMKKVEPVYPHIAIVAGISGTVKLHAIIAKDGSVEDLNVVAGHPLLAEAALDAVRQWRYRPYVLNGKPIEVETFITVVFRKPGQ